MQGSPNYAHAGPVAVLHQAIDPPVIEGARKPLKEGGYTDSGADIAAALRRAGVPVVTPDAAPDEAHDDGWTFPDTGEGIADALGRGARVLWANTVLFAGHPIEAVSGVRIVGQRPPDVHRFDDKWYARTVMVEAGLPFPAALLAGPTARPGIVAADSISDALLERMGMRQGAIVKPVRGRGSQGVSFAPSAAATRIAAARLFAAVSQGAEGAVPVYGSRAIVEAFLPGDEITVAVFPPGDYRIAGAWKQEARHWALPAIRRIGHDCGIAPYSGVVPVSDNSLLLPAAEAMRPEVAAAKAHCVAAAALIGARAPVRIDCRRSDAGPFMLFDVNLKPNLTGPGRPGRDRAESLVSLAGGGVGWSYADMLLELLRGAWPS